jgi:hypothetical protein
MVLGNLVKVQVGNLGVDVAANVAVPVDANVCGVSVISDAAPVTCQTD